MRVLLLTSVLFFCQLLHGSSAVERDVLDMVSVGLEEHSTDNSILLDLYLLEKIFIQRYTDAQLKEGEKIRKAVIKNVFPAYSNTKESEKIAKNMRSEAVKMRGPTFKSLPAYFNGYLVKVEDEWKIRKVDGVEITYEDVDSQNVMGLVELFYAMSSDDEKNENNYNVKKLLALIQIKHQIKEETEKAGRNMLNYEREFWDEYDLGSDLIQQAALANYSFSFVQPHSPIEYFGVDGNYYGDFGEFGNRTFAFMLRHHLDTDTYYKKLPHIPTIRGKCKMIMRERIEKLLRMSRKQTGKTFYLPIEFSEKKVSFFLISSNLHIFLRDFLGKQTVKDT